VGDGLCNR